MPKLKASEEVLSALLNFKALSDSDKLTLFEREFQTLIADLSSEEKSALKTSFTALKQSIKKGAETSSAIRTLRSIDYKLLESVYHERKAKKK